MKILLVDDHAIVRDGLRRLLKDLAEEDIFEASDSTVAIECVKAFKPELILLDLNLPGLGGLELIKRLIFYSETSKIIVLSMHAEPLYVSRALNAGAHGYLSKNVEPDELLTAVRKVAAGSRYVEADIAQQFALQGAEIAEIGVSMAHLSSRDLEIMRLLAGGRSLAEIADSIGIGYKTVANNCTAIKAKLGVSRTADLVRLAMEFGVR